MTQTSHLETAVIESVTKLAIALYQKNGHTDSLPPIVEFIAKQSLEMLDIFRTKPKQLVSPNQINKPVETAQSDQPEPEKPLWTQNQREAYYIITGREGMDIFEADEFKEFIVEKSKAPYMTETLAEYVLIEKNFTKFLTDFKQLLEAKKETNAAVTLGKDL